MTWDALGWRDRLAVLRIRSALRGASAAGHGGSRVAGPPEQTATRDDTVREWLQAHGQTPRLIELLWEPLAVAALNQPIDIAAGPTFRRRAGAHVSGAIPGTRRFALPLKPLDELYALPARRYIERTRRRRRDRRRRPHRVSGELAERHGRRSFPQCPRRHLCRTLVRARGCISGPACRTRPPFSTRPPTLTRRPSSRSTSGSIASSRIRCSSDCPAGRCSGCSTSGRCSGSRRRTCRSCRAALPASSDAGNQDLIDLAVSEVRDALPAARSAVMIRGVVVREKRATFSVAPGQPPRPPVETAGAGSVSRRRLDRHRAPRHDRGGRRQRPSGRGRRDGCRPLKTSLQRQGAHEPRGFTVPMESG